MKTIVKALVSIWFVLSVSALIFTGVAYTTNAKFMTGCELPSPPDRIESTMGPIPITYVDSLVVDGEPVWGATDFSTRRIRVRANIARSLTWQTIEHERLHQIVFDHGIDLSPREEEALADAIGEQRVGDMLRQCRK